MAYDKSEIAESLFLLNVLYKNSSFGYVFL